MIGRPAGSPDKVVRYVEQECVRCGRHFTRKLKANRQRWCCDCAPVRRKEYVAKYNADYRALNAPTLRAKKRASA